MRAHVKDGEPVPDIRRREMKTFDLMVDDLMDELPAGELDLASDTGRERFRNWLRMAVRRVARDMEWAYRRATDSALTQADGLMADPQRYERQAASRRKQRAQRAEWKAEQERQRIEWEQHRDETNQTYRELIADGKLAAMPGLKFRDDLMNGPRLPEKNEPEK